MAAADQSLENRRLKEIVDAAFLRDADVSLNSDMERHQPTDVPAEQCGCNCHNARSRATTINTESDMPDSAVWP